MPMKGLLGVAAIGLAGLLLVGCGGVTAPVVPPTGVIFTSVKAPLDVQFNKTELGSKMGMASSTSILGFAFGDASTMAAARNGQLKVINAASYTTIVYGD
jgi:hypothetical protein